MATNGQPKGVYDPVSPTSNSPSEVSFCSEEPSLPTQHQSSPIRTNIMKCSGVLIVLIIFAVLARIGNSDRLLRDGVYSPFDIPKAEAFKFRVYCPVKYYRHYLDEIFGEDPKNREFRRRLS